MVSNYLVEAPQILRFGPHTTNAGVEFNVQQNGDSVMWFKVANGKGTIVVKFDEERLNGYFGGGDLITCSIPKKFFESPGEHKIYLLDTATGLTSNIVIFTVK
jgi:hypothetical protein